MSTASSMRLRIIPPNENNNDIPIRLGTDVIQMINDAIQAGPGKKSHGSSSGFYGPVKYTISYNIKTIKGNKDAYDEDEIDEDENESEYDNMESKFSNQFKKSPYWGIKGRRPYIARY